MEFMVWATGDVAFKRSVRWRSQLSGRQGQAGDAIGVNDAGGGAAPPINTDLSVVLVATRHPSETASLVQTPCNRFPAPVGWTIRERSKIAYADCAVKDG